MEFYNQTAYALSKNLTRRYSTSFSMSSRLFQKEIQPDIFAIYGLARIADEIVDTYLQPDAKQRLNELEKETYRAMSSGYSTNPIVHAFALTAQEYSFEKELIEAFYVSMRMDLEPRVFTKETYDQYIFGSAEVIGLMCLRVFCQKDTSMYATLAPGAKALGAAYQKVNFLRDFAADYHERKRIYFPGVTFDNFSEAQKQTVIDDIDHDFEVALPALRALPRSCKRATKLSYLLYTELLNQLRNASVETIKTTRVSVTGWRKFLLLMRALVGRSM